MRSRSIRSSNDSSSASAPPYCSCEETKRTGVGRSAIGERPERLDELGGVLAHDALDLGLEATAEALDGELLGVLADACGIEAREIDVAERLGELVGGSVAHQKPRFPVDDGV